jgi:hypothetical protein
MLAVPVARQFEQVMNARYLQYEGYGRAADHLDDPRTVRDFIAAIPGCEAKLAGYSQPGNEEIFAELDDFLDLAATGAI